MTEPMGVSALERLEWVGTGNKSGGDAMPARKKWRRTITVRGHRFLWYVDEDRDGMGRVLHLFTPDKSLVVKYWLECQRAYPGNPALVVSERGVSEAVADTPDWERRAVATPGFVAEVAEWLLQRQSQRPGSPA
jgi:hypothetical protein